MSFEYATVTKALMFGIALTSVVAGIFDLKHYLNLQLVPHISKHHQYWRLFVHQFACASSSDLLLTELLLYNVGIPIERGFGGVKYASFFVISAVTTMLVSFVTLLLCQLTAVTRTTFNNIPAGPIAIIFAVVYQYMRLVPSAYHFKVFGVGMSDKIWVYAIAIQLALARLPSTLLPTVVGLFVGYLYRSDFLQLKSWRIPPKAVKLAEDWVKPLLGAEKPLRRTNRVLPGPRAQDGTRGSRRAVNPTDDEVITTARNSNTRRSLGTNMRTAHSGDSNTSRTEALSGGLHAADEAQDRSGAGPNANGMGGGMVRQWMSELASGARPVAQGGATVRAPSEGEVAILTGMFPDMDREVVLGVLQRSPSIEAAAETLLASQAAS
ncbi:hypothetical protein BD309DRAFT_971994 [Dichomitus squalens]|uniref:Peptidase S54 rhomboid domain-containing protein n=1 Tax=Dichomitus squalens TaxID=114155 RepID=A0A4Q9Q844_9APHY|nr:hypothetical protein BD311DRAFT_749141 [Dichomitus squalens]TBU38398.1 hypothetical protein BD309DRAFT_971994 [Dichomitus squalens]TBU63206.1 hypothetical protein BD310DRAFT_916977 [Dichomitus squalens]